MQNRWSSGELARELRLAKLRECRSGVQENLQCAPGTCALSLMVPVTPLANLLVGGSCHPSFCVTLHPRPPRLRACNADLAMVSVWGDGLFLGCLTDHLHRWQQNGLRGGLGLGSFRVYKLPPPT